MYVKYKSPQVLAVLRLLSNHIKTHQIFLNLGLLMKKLSAIFLCTLLFSFTWINHAHSQQRFHEEQLQRFANGSVEINILIEEYLPKLQLAEEGGDNLTANEIRIEFSERTSEIVENNGLDMQTYNDIATAIMENPELMQRVRQMAQ